jgi:hypothetical protein
MPPWPAEASVSLQPCRYPTKSVSRPMSAPVLDPLSYMSFLTDFDSCPPGMWSQSFCDFCTITHFVHAKQTGKIIVQRMIHCLHSVIQIVLLRTLALDDQLHAPDSALKITSPGGLKPAPTIRKITMRRELPSNLTNKWVRASARTAPPRSFTRHWVFPEGCGAARKVDPLRNKGTELPYHFLDLGLH